MRSNAFGHSGLHDALHCYFGRSCCTPIVVAQGAEELTDVRSRPKVFLTMTIIYTTIAPHTRCWYLTLPTCPPVASLFCFLFVRHSRTGTRSKCTELSTGHRTEHACVSSSFFGCVWNSLTMLTLLRRQAINCTVLSPVSRVNCIVLVTAVNVSNRARGALDQLEFGQLAKEFQVLLRFCVLDMVPR